MRLGKVCGLPTGAGVLALALLSGVAVADPARPNVVLLYVDDLRWDVFGHTGYPVQTPAIDRLAAEGIRFTEAFVISSLCAPSRATFLTGVYPHRHGVTGNTSILGFDDLPTLPALLQQRGYRTGLVGKWHLGGGLGRRPGYDHWFAHVGGTSYRDTQYDDNGRLISRQGYSTDVETDEALRFIDANRTRPFFLQLSYAAVHDPFEPPRRHIDRYAGTEWPRRPNARKVDAYFRQRYSETLQAVDDSVARVLAGLEQAGILDNTIVIFTSDNGYLFGEHDRTDKRLFFEESIRVPLIVRWPRLAAPGSVRHEMALSVDLPPTILDLAGAAVPAHMHGRSLAPVLRAEPVRWREDWVYVYHRELPWPQLSTMVALRTERYKYVEFPEGGDMWCYLSGQPMLFDLERDPYEMNDVAGDRTYRDIRQELAKRLRQATRELGYRNLPLGDQAVAGQLTLLSQRYPWFAQAMGRYYPSGWNGWDSRVCTGTYW